MKSEMFFGALLTLIAVYASGAVMHPDLMVESVQMPASVEHVNGIREGLKLGMLLSNGDKIHTGLDARVRLRLADGSIVKLGENAVLGLDDLAQRPDKLKQLVTATLNVLSGAFRFTTQAIYKYRGERDVKVKLVTITAGIRGTDIWGKQTDDRDVLALLEGKIIVVNGNTAFTMDQPQSVYIAPKGGAPLPVAPLDPQQLGKWSLETEIIPGGGAVIAGGRWKVYLATVDTQKKALALYDRLGDVGYAADILPITQASSIVYRLRISHLPSKQDAQILAMKLSEHKDALGIETPTVAVK